MHHREQSTDGGRVVTELLARGGHSVDRQGRNHGATKPRCAGGIKGAHSLTLGNGRERGNGESGRQPAREFPRAKDRGARETLHVIGAGAPRRSRSNPPRVKEVAEVEQVRSLEKERPAFVEEDLVRRKV